MCFWLDSVPYAALCQTFELIEATPKRLQILDYLVKFLIQVIKLSPESLLTVIYLSINKVKPVWFLQNCLWHLVFGRESDRPILIFAIVALSWIWRTWTGHWWIIAFESNCRVNRERNEKDQGWLCRDWRSGNCCYGKYDLASFHICQCTQKKRWLTSILHCDYGNPRTVEVTSPPCSNPRL